MKLVPAEAVFATLESELGARMRRGALGTIVFAGCFGGYLLVQDLAVPTTTLRSSWDAMIPFWPWMVVVYLAFFPYVVTAAFACPAERFPTILIAGVIATVSAWVCFLVFPASLDRPDLMSIDPQVRWIFGLVHSVDDAHNTFPSLHVAITWVCSTAFWSGRLRWPAVIGAAAISLSTLTIKQHALVDVGGGMALAAAACGLTTAAFARRRL